MTFPDATVGVLLLVCIGLALASTAGAIFLWARVKRLRAAYAGVFDPSRGGDVVEVLERLFTDQDRLRRDIGVVHRNTEHLRELLRDSVSRVGLVRYDAFSDMGGGLSFSAALLDERGDGIVLTAINGRTEARAYAKPVAAGSSSHNLSPEEVAAIEAAMSGEKGAVAATPRRLRRGRAAS